MNKSFIKRPLCFILSLIMIVGLYPFSILTVGSAVPSPFSAMGETKTADPSTMNDWEKYFNDTTTEYAGGVWTDKSVFTDASAFAANGISMKNTDDFLVALSAMASNMTVEGMEYAPTDTVFLLDVSGSMDRSRNALADEMVDAANKSIASLLSSGKHNRVSVIAYSDGQATTLLSLGRYTTGTDGQYLNYNYNSGFFGWGAYEEIKLDPDTRIEGTTTSPNNNSVNVTGATYIQSGLKKAIDIFLAQNGNTTVNDPALGTLSRIPVVVLMSDGEPTYGSTDFTNPQANSYFGDGKTGQSIGAELAFVTQLTLAYTKTRINAIYGDSLIYTVGLGVGSNDNAKSVLDPAKSSTTAINDFWAQYNNPSATRVNLSDNRTVTKIDTPLDKNYVEQYIEVSTTTADPGADLVAAFDDIVKQIQLKSKFYPTLVEGSEYLSGYVSFVDKLGKYMEVKDVKGLLINNQLHTGRSFAKHLIEHHANGNIATDPNDVCYAFIDSVETRLGIDEGTALTLVELAIRNGQLSYNAASNTFSNYIGWFSDANGNFVGFWHEGIANIPAAATHINRSYGFFGDTDVSHDIDEHDMLYATVRVREEIATGFESVAFAVPASLIPTLTYNVSLDEHGNPTNITTTGDRFPIRLVYEAGLDSEINEVTVQSLVTDAEYLAEHVKNGEYEFYTNRFDHGTDVTAYGTNNTYSYFTPSKENERYYYLTDSPIYSDTNGTLYTGSIPSPGGTYYRAVTVYQKNGSNFSKNTVYEQIMPYALSSASHLVQKNGVWYVKAGTAHNYVENNEVAKTANRTDSIAYSYHPFVDTEHSYVIGAVLGNNGRLVVTPATGIKVTKTVEEVSTDSAAPTSFNFTVTNKTNGADGATYKTYHVTANGVVTEGIISFTTGQASFSIKDGEKFYITGMTAGNVFTVTEQSNDYYYCKNNNIDLTVVDKSLATAAFVNTARGKGNLVVAKEVIHQLGTGYQIPADKSFDFEVTLEGVGVAGKTFAATHSGDATVKSVTVGADGKVTFSLKHDEQFEINGLPEGTVATVTETNIPAGFTATYTNDGIVTVEKGKTAFVEAANTYKPDSATVNSQIIIESKKTLLNADDTPADWGNRTFTATLEKFDGSEWVTLETDTANKDKQYFSFSLKNEVYTSAGTYSYQIYEIVPSDPEGVFYDFTWHTFTVHVGDSDMDGKLEILKVVSDNTENELTPVNNVWTIPANFTNKLEELVPADVVIDIQKEIINESDSALAALSRYQFELYKNEACTVIATKDNTDGVAEIVFNPTDAVGEGWFDIIIDKAGSYTFYVKEKNTGIAGMTYDPKVVKVDVTVTAVNGTLTAEMAYSESLNSDGELVFTNTYKPTSATLDIDVRKSLTGRDLAEGEFSFTITDADGNFGNYTETVKNTANGDVPFTTLTFTKVGTYKFDISEVKGELGGVTYDSNKHRVIVTVTDNGGALTASYVVESSANNYIIFNNTYNAKSVKHQIRGTKDLEGRDLLNAEFKFTLAVSDLNGNVAAGAQSYTVENLLDGSFSFPEIEYTKVGDYYYTVTEVNDSAIPGIKYDTTKYIVKITVKDDLKGQLSVDSTTIHIAGNGTANEIKFTNTYTPAPTTGDIAGTKSFKQDIGGVLTDKDLADGKFSFTLYLSNEKWETVSQIERTTNNANGTFAFKTLNFDKAGTYYYLVNEYHGGTTVNGIVYDSSVYKIKIVVEDNKTGALKATTHIYNSNAVPVDTITFSNRYTFTDSDSIIISGEKVLENKTLEENKFEFVLTDITDNANPKILGSVFNKADGKFAFDAITYTAPGTYTYTVHEVNGGQTIDGITYDNTVYTITVTVTDNGNGHLNATQEINGANSIKFTNSYSTNKVTATISGTKELIGRDLKDGEFTFILKDSAGNEIKAINKNGKFEFETLTFDKVGTYTYTVSEEKGSLGGITYDAHSYTVTVTVTDDGKGQLVASVSGGDNIKFTNTYTANEVTAIIGGTKELTGRDLKDGEFTFILRDSDGKEIEATNVGNNFTFGNLTFTKAGVYTYTVSEKAGTLGGITYDTKSYIVTVTITDDGKGQLIASVSGADAIKFTNHYVPTAIEVTINGTKTYTTDVSGTVENKDFGAGTFDFQLFEADSAWNVAAGAKPYKTTANAADKSFTFDKLSFTAAGTYYYVVKEVHGGQTINGTTFDSTEYRVKIVVTDDLTGNLSTAVTYYKGNTEVTQIAFANTYTATNPHHIQFSGTKVLTGYTGPTKEFEFVLYKAKLEGGVYVVDGASIDTVKSATGSFFFKEIDIQSAGTHYYIVKEVLPTNYKKGDVIDGITYDTTEYLITVVVTDDNNGNLTADVSGDEGILFTNTYTANKVTAIIGGTKELIGRDLKNGEFTFILKDSAGNEIKAINKNGKFEFETLTFDKVGTYTYTVSEEKGSLGGIIYDAHIYTVTVTVTDDGKGQLVASVSGADAIKFTNTYSSNEVSATISGTKELVGRDLKDGEFTFILRDSDGKEIEATNVGNNFTFGTLTFTKAGVYTYTISEKAGTLGGITYDTKSYTVTVTVTDDGKGQLVATQKIEGADSIKFTNTYKAEETSVIVKGTKMLEGRPLVAGEFEFILEGEGVSQTVKVNANGSFEFKAITYDKAGTYNYTVKEVKGTLAGITYDDAVYNITVKVVDEGNGKFSATVTGADNIKFTNTYKASQSEIVFSGKKELTGRDINDGEFKFILKDENGKEIETVSNSGKTFSFKALSFDKAGTYTYTISEVNNSLGGVTYDTTVYTVVVTVTDDTATGKLVAKSSISENGFVFTNTYNTESVKATIKANKKLTGKTLADGEFSFVIAEVGGSYTETVKNAADGSISFSELTFDKVGTYTYTVSEVIGFAGGIKYDDTKYTVTITVTDDGKGNLIAEVDGENGIIFNNSYNTENTEVRFSGTKQLLGRNLAAGEFEVILEGSGVSQTVKVNADGSFAFDAISYDKTGTHKYTVKEIKGNVAGVTYDETIYEITVEVTDDGNGKLITKVTGADSITFTNKYKATSAEIIFSGNKELTGRPLKAGEFSFTLVGANDGVNETVQNDANGNFVFHTIKYDTAGEYNYTISEIKGTLGGVTYDSKVYNVKVAVTDDGNGKLVAKIQDPTPVVFKNTYSSEKTSVQIGGNKILTGRDLTAGEFSFVISGNGINETVTNDANGNFVFPTIEYTAAGTYTYTVSEIKGTLPGVKYDEKIYTVTVNVTDDGNGKLSAEASGANSIVFTNTYNAAPDSIGFAGIKNLEGKPLAANEFSFILIDTKTGAVIETVTNDANGNFSFSALTFTTAGVYTYRIEETISTRPEISYDTNVYNITVTVTDQNGVLKCTAAITDSTGANVNNIVFNNKYNITSTSLQLSATKELTGRELKVGEFSFVLTDITDPNNKKAIQTVTNGANGEIHFAAIEYSTAGTYKYTIHEVNNELGGITYDKISYAITVTVTDNGNGTLSKDVKVQYLLDPSSTIWRDTTIDSINFKNKYESANASLKVFGHKNLVGRDLKKGEFKFELRYLFGDQVLYTATNEENGTFSFPEIIYTTPGIHYYVVKEVNNNISGITYDESSFMIYVSVTDNGNGKLMAFATIPEFIGFTNYYTPEPASVQFEATKILSGRPMTDSEFSFELKDSAGNVIETVKNSADGTIAFSAIEYTSAGTYNYTVSEVPGNDASVLYDATVYPITVTVTDNGSGKLVATVQSDSIVFTNRALTPATVTFEGINFLDLVLTGGFNFVMKEGENVIANATSDENGYFNFGTLVYDREGTYTYTISEIAGDNEKIIYDTNVFTVTVTVTLEGTAFKANVKVDALIPLETAKIRRSNVTTTGIEFYNWTLPEETTTAPEETTATPEETTVAPEETTVVPEDTSGTPEDTSVAPEDTTVAPEETTVAPEDTSGTPEDTSGTPDDTTIDPDDSTETPNPSTGDGNKVIIWFGAIIVAFCATAGALFSKKRTANADNE